VIEKGFVRYEDFAEEAFVSGLCRQKYRMTRRIFFPDIHRAP